MKQALRILLAVLVLAALLFILILPPFVDSYNNRLLQKPPYQVSGAAKEQHSKLVVADLHADSLLWGRDLLARSSRGHVDLPRLQQGNVALQVFTVVTSVPRGLSSERGKDRSDLIRYLAMAELWPVRTWGSPKERALYQAQRLQEMASRSGGKLTMLRSKADLDGFLERRAKDPTLVAAMLGAEGAQGLEGKIANLTALYEAGFRMMSPAHFTDTEIGGSASGAERTGLTGLGRNWVKEMESRHMLIDVAHASPRTVADILFLAKRPVVASHTGVRGVCDNPRNLSDVQLQGIARSGGVVGIGYWETATCGKDAKAIAKSVRYAVDLMGVDHVALGSDFDGATTEPFDATGTPMITQALMEEGFAADDIAKIMGGNMVRVLREVLPEK